MIITAEIIEINKILNEYQGDQARIWLFDITHIKLAIRIDSKKDKEVLFLVITGCKYIRGLFSLNSPEFFVNQYFDDEISETIFKVKDNKSDFELSSNTGIALAKGLESEFGNSFENFLKR
ncbi:hypothetical protein J2810_002453 [Chryseobacterium rhizosphaerae]|uniref:hypothetical protein n=1 Tax=Chryseobacterium rhizosphaerae TaxID=395937 RepID=UPI0006490FBB|nr:hypothetical protein [Chryseobacterium rhizosphaerae]MDR6546394.1 hypothetical protein [Chryseobacterium rhizosphaerae]